MLKNKKYLLVLAFFIALLAPTPASAATSFLIGKKVLKRDSEQMGHFQGYALHYQYFETDASIKDLLYYWNTILKLDIKIQKLVDLWLISFNKENNHVLVQLQAFSDTKTVGWWSELDIENQQQVFVPDVIRKVASQWWTYQSEADTALHIMFKASLPVTALEHLIRKHLWHPVFHYCNELHACVWQKQNQQMRWWFDTNNAMWHAQFWPVDTHD